MKIYILCMLSGIMGVIIHAYITDTLFAKKQVQVQKVPQEQVVVMSEITKENFNRFLNVLDKEHSKIMQHLEDYCFHSVEIHYEILAITTITNDTIRNLLKDEIKRVIRQKAIEFNEKGGEI